MLKKLLNRYPSALTLITLTFLLPAMSFGLPFFGAKEQPIIFNFDFTINFVQPGEKWPIVKLFKPVEKQAYEQFGKPDAFRILYNKQGDIKIRSVVEQEWKGKKMKTIPSYTWVYSQRNEEIVFSGETFYTQPLTDAVRLALTSGDPESVKALEDGLVEWTYYSTGKIYRIYGNKIVSVKEFPLWGRGISSDESLTAEDPPEDSKRLFIAVDIPPGVRAQLDDLIVRLKTGCRFVDSHPKWLPVQNLHITLAFLGQIADARLPEIEEAMTLAAKDAPPFELGVSGLGLFPPDSRAPKVLSADVVDKDKSLKLLHDSLAIELRNRGFEVQARAFHPHLTLARLTSIKTSSRLGPLVASHAGFLNSKFPVNEIVLFESRPTAVGVTYDGLIRTGLSS